MKEKNRKVLIYYWSQNNLGDDLLVINFIQHTNFKEYYLLKNKFANPGMEERSFHSIKSFVGKNKNVFHSKTTLQDLQQIDYFDDFDLVLIGGSIWSEKTLKWKKDLFPFLFKKMKSTSTIGNNLSIFKNEDSYKVLNKILSHFDYSSFRDSYSIKFINNNVFYHDPIYSMKLPKKINHKENNIVVSFSTPIKNFNIDFDEEKNGLDIFKQIKKISNKNKIKEILLISYCDYVDLNNSIYKLSNLLKTEEFLKPLIRVVSYKNNINEIIDIYRNSKWSIATRYHSLVLSNLFSEKVYAISYDNKCENHLNDLGLNQQKWYKTKSIDINKIKDSSKEHIENYLKNVFK